MSASALSRQARTSHHGKVSPLPMAAARSKKKKEAEAMVLALRRDIEALCRESGRIRTFEEKRLILTAALERRREVIESGGNISDTQLANEIGAQFHVSADNGKVSCVKELLKSRDAEKVVIISERHPTRGRKAYWELRKLKPLHLVEIEPSSSTTRSTTTASRCRTSTTHEEGDRRLAQGIR